MEGLWVFAAVLVCPLAMGLSPIHGHGLGVNPADGSLFIATHTGLFRAGPNSRKAVRIVDRFQDTMGFSIVGPNRFLGSGHPDAREQKPPPLLGLIESADAGKTWTPISLLGEADFHVLRSAGARVYGYDASNDRLLASADAAKHGKSSTNPARSSISARTRAIRNGSSRRQSVASSKGCTRPRTVGRAGSA